MNTPKLAEAGGFYTSCNIKSEAHEMVC